MAGTVEGGKKAATTNKLRYGNTHYETLGRKGGSATGVKKGFAARPELARSAGTKGGRTRRKKEVAPTRGWFARLLGLLAF